MKIKNGIKDKLHVTAVIDNTSFELKVDSGAKCNVISTKTIKSLALYKKPPLNMKKKVKTGDLQQRHNRNYGYVCTKL